MSKLKKSDWLFFIAATMFIMAGATGPNKTFYAIGAAFFAIGFSRLSKK